MPNATLPTAVVLAAVALTAPRSLAQSIGMVRLAGTPEQIGTTWGEMNKAIIAEDFETAFLKRAAKAGISKETLLKRSEAAVRIIKEIAPHWIEEARAIARAAGVDEDLYVAYFDSVIRSRFLHKDPDECTSYAVSPEHADGAILFHKNRDNRDSPQAVYLVESSREGINKFIAISNATGIHGFSMMANDKGLAGSADTPGPRGKDLKPAIHQSRGIMSATMLRYIAERASTCREALAFIKDCVAKGWYAGGTVGGSHWLLVDREGTILEVWNNPGYVDSKVHTQKAYFSARSDHTAARRLREAQRPVDFHLFHNVSRDRSICFNSSIAGMTVEIDPTHPELFTCAWISLPASSVSFPLLMGQPSTPDCLLDGKAYRLGRTTTGKPRLWEATERGIHESKEQLRKKVSAELPKGDPAQTSQALDHWSQQQAEMLLQLLKSHQ